MTERDLMIVNAVFGNQIHAARAGEQNTLCGQERGKRAPWILVEWL